MSLAATEQELRAMMQRAVFARDSGFRLVAVSEGTCTLQVPFTPALERPGGLVGGPAFMAAADVAMWLAVLTRLGSGDGSVTAGLNTTFLGAARRVDFFCTARILKLGRRLIYGVAECVTGEGRLLTHHTVTYARPEKSTGPQ
jgi:acyl-coenzyme A thioesterase PaaI-like protein